MEVLIKQTAKPTTRPMTTDDIPMLVLEHEWLREVYYDYFDQGRGPALVIEDADGIIACVGASIIFPGMWEIWFSLIREGHNKIIVKEAKRLFKELDVRRFQCTISNDVGRRFVEFFDFKCETPNGMVGYNPDGSTAWLYSRTK